MSKYVTVSNNFVEIFKMFNVIKQTENIKLLTRKERILLLVAALDMYSEENDIVIENFKEFKSELNLIFDIQQDKECDDMDIIELVQETGKYIDSTCIKTLNGKNLPSATTDEESIILRRDINISNIVK